MALTIPELFAGAVAEVPDRTWLLYEDESWTYAEAKAQIDRAAAALAERGIGAGDLVLASAPNHPHFVFAWLATVSLGAIWVPCDPRYSETELNGLLKQVRPEGRACRTTTSASCSVTADR